MSAGEKRRDPRQFLKYPAKIDLGDGMPPRPCMLEDISKSGARITIKGADQLPDRLSLLLAQKDKAARRCAVVWRRGDEVGLEFMKFPATKKSAGPRSTYRDMMRRR